METMHRGAASSPNNLNNSSSSSQTESSPNNLNNPFTQPPTESSQNNLNNPVTQPLTESSPNNLNNPVTQPRTESSPNNLNNSSSRTQTECSPNNLNNPVTQPPTESSPNNLNNTVTQPRTESSPNNLNNPVTQPPTESSPNNLNNPVSPPQTEGSPNNLNNPVSPPQTEGSPNNLNNPISPPQTESSPNSVNNTGEENSCERKPKQSTKSIQTEGESTNYNFTFIQLFIMQLALSTSVSVLLSVSVTYWLTNKPGEKCSACEKNYCPDEPIKTPDVNITALIEKRLSDLNITKAEFLYSKTELYGVNITQVKKLYEGRISGLEKTLLDYQNNYSVIQDELGHCTAMKEEVQTNFSQVVSNFTILKDDIDKGQSFMYGLKGRLDFADYSTINPEYTFIILVILGLGETIIGFLLLRMMIKWKQTLEKSNPNTTQAPVGSLNHTSPPEKLKSKTNGEQHAQKSVLDRIWKCNLEPNICVVGFDKETLQKHKAMVDGIISGKFDIKTKLIKTNEDILASPKSKVMIVFVSSNARHIILEGEREIGNVKVTTVTGIEKMGAKVILVYIGDAIVKEIGPQEMWSEKLGSAAKHPVLKKLKQSQCLYSVYHKFSEYQEKQLLKNVENSLTK